MAEQFFVLTNVRIHPACANACSRALHMSEKHLLLRVSVTIPLRVKHENKEGRCCKRAVLEQKSMF